MLKKTLPSNSVKVGDMGSRRGSKPWDAKHGRKKTAPKRKSIYQSKLHLIKLGK